MINEQLEFEPVRRALYTPWELFAGFLDDDPQSFAQTTDFKIYREFLRQGGSTPRDPYVAMLRALHDSSMTQLTGQFIDDKKVVAIMGGHNVLRGTDDYEQVAGLARTLAERGYLVASGGGPGAMEASHLGAAHAGHSDAAFRSALALLAQTPELSAGHWSALSHAGEPNSAFIRAIHDWVQPALDLARTLENPGESLAVPTWHYGHEATTPFATAIGKLFQNSIREDGLLAIATHGVVFSPGKAGTLQEVFQDAAQNAYSAYGVSPMVLLGRAFWTTEFPVAPVLASLFSDQYHRIVLITDDVDEAVAFIEAAEPTPSKLHPRHTPAE